MFLIIFGTIFVAFCIVISERFTDEFSVTSGIALSLFISSQLNIRL